MDSFIFPLNGCSEFILIIEKKCVILSKISVYLLIVIVYCYQNIVNIGENPIALIKISINIIHKPQSWTEHFPKAFSANIYLLIEYQMYVTNWFSGCCCCFLFFNYFFISCINVYCVYVFFRNSGNCWF